MQMAILVTLNGIDKRTLPADLEVSSLCDDNFTTHSYGDGSKAKK